MEIQSEVLEEFKKKLEMEHPIRLQILHVLLKGRTWEEALVKVYDDLVSEGFNSEKVRIYMVYALRESELTLSDVLLLQ